MTLKQIAALGRKLVVFLGLFADCFGRREARGLLRVYVQGQLSDVQRKTVEGIALEFGKAPRTLQRFLETIKWDAERFHDRCQQLVARNVLTQEVKYFVANRVPGDKGISVRWLLRVAFGRWSVERCFRVAKDELGMDHYQVRGWHCLHRHFYLTQASYLFCARVRQQYNAATEQPDRLTIEQVRSATNTWPSASDLKPPARRERYQKERNNQRYHQQRNRQAGTSHTKTRIARLTAMCIDVNRIKSCVT